MNNIAEMLYTCEKCCEKFNRQNAYNKHIALNSCQEKSSDSENESAVESADPKQVPFEKMVLEKLEYLINRVDEIEKMVNKPVQREFTAEVLSLPEKVLKTSLKSHSLDSDVDLLFRYYLKPVPRNVRCIRLKNDEKGKGTKYEYYLNGQWNPDPQGKIIRDQLCQNLYKTYISINRKDNFENLVFIENQEHIYKIDNARYQNSIFRKFCEMY